MAAQTEEKIDTVGEIAGKIWAYLCKKHTASAVDMRKALVVQNSILFMALGWLAREGKIEISKEGGIYYFKLVV